MKSTKSMKSSKPPSHFMTFDTTSRPMSGDVLIPFAFDEVHCRKVGRGDIPPIIHLWRHKKAFVMGLRDRKLPYAPEAMAWLREQGYAVGVRHSGGAAVPLDSGVINISMLLPKSPGSVDFHDDFERMVGLLEETVFRMGAKLDKGEVKGSYCPGAYDLSIHGRKFCGIAQRRQTHAFAVQAFIVVEGSGTERAELVREFYSIGARDVRDAEYPDIHPSTMGSLSELAGSVSCGAFISQLKKALSEWGKGPELTAYPVDASDQIECGAQKLKDRYDRA